MAIEEEKVLFLDGGDDGTETDVRRHSPASRSRLRMTTHLAIANLALLIICVLLSVALSAITSRTHRWKASHDSHATSLAEPYSPANVAIEYEYRQVVENDTRFTGPPGPIWEKSMHQLMAGTLLRASEEEMQLLGDDSIPLKDGGYAAGLGVAHNLHCVKKIKQYIYKDHFYADLDSDGEEMAYIQIHADHCLDWLRQAIMCHVDYTMYTLDWSEHSLGQDIPAHKLPGPQKCVNWEKLHDWMLARSANTDMLQRPER